MGKIATEKYWFSLIDRTDYPHGGGDYIARPKNRF